MSQQFPSEDTNAPILPSHWEKAFSQRSTRCALRSSSPLFSVPKVTGIVIHCIQRSIWLGQLGIDR